MVSSESVDGGSQLCRGGDVLYDIGDPSSRDILARIGRGTCSAKQISADLDLSSSTVYRRTTLHEDNGLVDSRLELGHKGDQFKVYKTTVDCVIISVESDEYDVGIYRQDDLSDRFADLWNEVGFPQVPDG